MSKISVDEVKRIAALARIGLTSEETARMSVELGNILEFVEQLQKVDISDTLPTDQVTGLEDIWREDVVKPGLPREQLLAGAPAQKDGYIVVKRVLNG
jgi:aspartyl-tRNA(Asn)/glutamyl-tRNA(Gln) amidotransferase subunit C